MEQRTEFRVEANCAIDGCALTVDKMVINGLERAVPKIIQRFLNEHSVHQTEAHNILREVETRYSNGTVVIALPADLSDSVSPAAIDALKWEVRAVIHGERFAARRAHDVPVSPQPEVAQPSSSNYGAVNAVAPTGETLAVPEVRGPEAESMHDPIAGSTLPAAPAQQGPSPASSNGTAVDSTGERSEIVLPIAAPVASPAVTDLVPNSGYGGHAKPSPQVSDGTGPTPSDLRGPECPPGLPLGTDHNKTEPLVWSGTPLPARVDQRILVARLTRATLATIRGGKNQVVLIPDVNGSATVGVGDNLTNKLLGLQARSSGLWMLRIYRTEHVAPGG